MTDIITIPLNRLSLWKGNVRKTGVSDGIGELAASISAPGFCNRSSYAKASAASTISSPASVVISR